MSCKCIVCQNVNGQRYHCNKCGLHCMLATKSNGYMCSKCVIAHELEKFNHMTTNVPNELPPLCRWKTDYVAQKISVTKYTLEQIKSDPLFGWGSSTNEIPCNPGNPNDYYNYDDYYWKAVRWHSYPWQIPEPIKSEWISEIDKLQNALSRAQLFLTN